MVYLTLQQAKNIINKLQKEEYEALSVGNETAYENCTTRIVVDENGDVEIYQNLNKLGWKTIYEWTIVGVYFNVVIGGHNYERFSNAMDEEG